jgi:hypothetical protein
LGAPPPVFLKNRKVFTYNQQPGREKRYKEDDSKEEVTSTNAIQAFTMISNNPPAEADCSKLKCRWRNMGFFVTTVRTMSIPVTIFAHLSCHQSHHDSRRQSQGVEKRIGQNTTPKGIQC